MNFLWQPPNNPQGAPAAATMERILNQEEILGRWNQLQDRNDRPEMSKVIDVLSQRIVAAERIAFGPPDCRNRITKIVCIGAGSLSRFTAQPGNIPEGQVPRLHTIGEIFAGVDRKDLGPHPRPSSLPWPVTVVQTNYKAYANTLSAIRFAQVLDNKYTTLYGPNRDTANIEVVLCDSKYTEADAEFFKDLRCTTGVHVRTITDVDPVKEVNTNTLLISFTEIVYGADLVAPVILTPAREPSHELHKSPCVWSSWKGITGLDTEVDYLNTRFSGC